MGYIQNEAGIFSLDELCGHAGDLVATAWQKYGGDVLDLHKVVGSAFYSDLKRTMLWEVARSVLGHDPKNFAQQTGDCVSFGMKNALEHLSAFQIANGDQSEWHYFFPPYLWGMGRLAPDCGNNQLGRRLGSVGLWQAKAVTLYGALRADYNNVPAYSKAVALEWGNQPGPAATYIAEAKQHLVKSYAKVAKTADVDAALASGFPCTVASSVGYTMEPARDGFHHRSGSWGHQMCVIGFDPGDDKIEPHYCILNSWGDVMGQIKDFRTNDLWPPGTLRVRRADLQIMLDEDDSFAISNFSGFPLRRLPQDQFSPW